MDIKHQALTNMTEQLEPYIFPKGECSLIGPEVGKEVRDGIAIFFQSRRTFNPASPHPKGGSYRFVQFVEGQIVAGLQVMSLTGDDGLVANVYCRPEHRRRGYAAGLLERAKEQFTTITLSEDQTVDGKAWTESLTQGFGSKPI
jgi:GNAT superfamily N-acetyltransferase